MSLPYVREFYLYTLPHIFTDQTIPDQFGPSKSTCPDQSDHYSRDQVHQLTISQNLSSKDFSYSRFPNVCELRITIPTDNNSFSLFSTFNQLKSLVLSVVNDDPIARDQLQTLLDKAPRLFSLELKGVLLTELSSKSNRRLIFHRNSRSFDKLTCTTLANSSLGSQCEYLALSVDNGVIIPDLIHNMKNLRILEFNCEEYQVQENFLEWLEQHLSPTCTISNGHTPYFTLWIC
jgi:hypothetical protein